MRAHMNCIENLPVFGAIVFALDRAGLDTPVLSGLALVVLGARVLQSTVHIAFRQTDTIASLRFAFYFAQIVAMIAMAVILLASV